MRLRGAVRDEAHINLTPLIDVVFLLLIFFMVSTTFERESEIEIELPEAGAERGNRDPEAVEVWIDAGGRIYLDGRRLEDTRVSSVRRALESLALPEPRPPLVIGADARTPYQAVISVMDAARQAGHVNLSLPVQALPEADSGAASSPGRSQTSSDPERH